MKLAIASSALLFFIGCETSTLPPQGTFTASWDIAIDGDFSGSLLSRCAQEGATYFGIASTPLGGGTTQLDIFNCSDGIGTTNPLFSDTYHVTLELLDSQKQVIAGSAQYLGLIDLLDGDEIDVGLNVFDFFSAPVDDGSFSVNWSVTASGLPASCDAVHASTVRLKVTEAGGGFHDEFYFDCSAETGTTGLVPPGTYDVELDILDNQDHQLNFDTLTGTFDIVAGTTTPLQPDVVFAF